MWHVSILSFHMQEGKKKIAGKLSASQRGELPHSTSARRAARSEQIKLLHTPARKTILTLKTSLATLCMVKGYINRSFAKDKTISIQSKQTHL